jgi:hypothetical protein
MHQLTGGQNISPMKKHDNDNGWNDSDKLGLPEA